MQNVRACLTELESLSSATTSESRRAVLRRLSDLFLTTSQQQGESDSAVFGEVIGRVASEAGEDARAELSLRIADRANTPRNLALSLANDTIAVAQPMLEHSPVLNTQDLVSIAQSQGPEYSLAIAKRRELAQPVTDVLVSKGDEPVLQTLAGNDGASFSPAGYKTLVKRADTNLEINDTISERSDLPANLRGDVRDNVERGFEQLGPSVGGLSLGDIADDISAGSDIPDIDPVKSKYRREVDHLHDSGNLSEDTVLRFVRARDKESAAYAISKLMGLAPRVIGGTLACGNAFAIAIIVKAAGFTRRALDDLIDLFKAKGTNTAQILADVRMLHTAVDTPTAYKIMRFLKVRMATEAAA